MGGSVHRSTTTKRISSCAAMMRLFATGQMIAAYWSGPPQQAIGPISSAKVCMPMERLLILYDRCGSWFQIKIIFLHSEILLQRSELVSSGGRCHSLFTGSFALSRRYIPIQELLFSYLYR